MDATPPAREPEKLRLPAAGVRYLLELALRTQLGEAWWAGFAAAHGEPGWLAEKRYAFRLEDATVVRTPRGEEEEMQSTAVATTVRVGNHLLTAEEAAAGLPQRRPFVDGDGAPVDPDTVALALTAPTGETRTFAYPAPGPDDSGVLTQQETGRFYVDWTPLDAEDGLWRWSLLGAMLLGTAQSDQDVFYVQRPIAPGP